MKYRANLSGLVQIFWSFTVPFTRLQVTVGKIIIENAKADEVLKEVAVITAKAEGGK